MNLLVPAALAFAAIIPIILLFYFMRPKRQERTIGSTLLWQQALQDLQASRPWQRLHVTPLLLLQLLAAIIIVLVLSRPAIFTNSPISGNTIIILQSSASMQATDVSPSRFEEARRDISDLIDTLGPDTRISLITMARTPQLLVANSNDKSYLNAQLQKARVTNQSADLEQALSLAGSLATRQSKVQVLVVGDGHVTNPDHALAVPFPVRYLRIGTDATNAALLGLSSRTVQGKLVAFAQVANYSSQTHSIPVELYADGRLVGVQTAQLPAHGSGAIQWSALPPTTRFLHARLVTQDALATDQEAWSVVSGSQQGRVLLVTRGNSFLEAALRLRSNIRLFEMQPEKYSPKSSYDLTIFDGFVPPSLPGGALFFINPPKGSYLFGSSDQELPVSRINAANDTLNLLDSVDLSSVRVIHNSHQLKPALWAQTIINAPETPLLVAGENNNRRVAALGFDLHDTDFPLQPAFPILIRNLTNWFLPEPVPGNGQVRAGTPITLQTWPGAEQAKITSPDQKTTTVGPPFPVVPFSGTDSIGIYQVTQHVQGQDLHGAFTVNLFDAAQSRLAPTSVLPVLHSTDFSTNGNSVAHQLREIWPWIAALLLLVLCIEWWLFSRSFRRQFQVSTSQARRLGGNTTRANKTFTSRIQQQLQERYNLLRKRFIKTTRRAIKSGIAGRSTRKKPMRPIR